MSLLRPLLILAVVIGASWLSTTWSEHHTGSNARPFDVLYMHVVPAALVHHGTAGHAEAGHSEAVNSEAVNSEAGDEHGGEAATTGDEHAGSVVDRALLAVPMPGFLGFLDADKDPENGVHIVLTNLQIFQIAAVLLIFIAFSGVPGYLRTGRGDAITRVLAGFCGWVRDEMVYPVMGEDNGRRFLPFFLSIFFFILFMNLMGLVPGAATATASIFVTAALALITFGSMIGAGMAAQGPVKFFKNLVPHVPGWLWPLMFLVEILGLLVKPFALMIRLFANMTGGHLVVLSFMGLIFFFAGETLSATAWAISPIAVAFAVFIMIIEAFVALLQAYIFTQLSVIFVGASIHPEH